MGLWATPFLLLLLPEGFLLPRDFAWTVTRAVLVLVAGTALWAALAVAVLRLLSAGTVALELQVRVITTRGQVDGLSCASSRANRAEEARLAVQTAA